MESYLADVPLGVQYPDWTRWHPAHLKTYGSSKTFTDGCVLFVDGAIKELKPLPDSAGFEATVITDKEYGVSVQMDKKDAPTWFCGCADHHHKRPCVHSFATLAALVYLLREHNYVPLAPIQRNVNVLAAGIDQSQNGSTMSLSRLRIVRSEDQTLTVRANAPLPWTLISKINPYAAEQSSRANVATYSVLLHSHVQWPAVLELQAFAKKKRIPLEFETTLGQCLTIQGVDKPLTAEIALNLSTKTGRIHPKTTPIQLNSTSPKVAFEFGKKGVLFDNGRLCPMEAESGSAILKILLPSSLERARTPVTAKSLPQDTFNRIVCGLERPYREILSLACLQIDGELLEATSDGPLTDAPAPILLELNSKTERGRLHYNVDLYAHCGDSKISLENLMHQLRELAENAAGDSRLLKTKARIHRLLETTAELALVACPVAREPLIETALDDSNFADKAIYAAAKRFLKTVEDNYLNDQPNCRVPLVIRHEGAPDSWSRAALPLPGLLQLTARLHRLDAIRVFTNTIVLHPTEIPADTSILIELVSVCQSHGFKIRVDGNELDSASVEINIDATSDEKFDWFELKAEIRCGDATIPREQWEALIRDDLMMRANGRTLIPRLNHAEAVERLIEMVPERQSGRRKGRRSTPDETEEASPVHRLQMLDWIALRREGATVRLPDEAEAIFQRLLQFETIPKRKLPKGIQAKLRAYQHRGFEWLAFLHEHRFGACLADDMGLGKTLQTITFLADLKTRSRRQRFLAVLPPSLIFNWRNEVEKFAPQIRVAEYTTPDRNLKNCLKADLILTTYGIVHRDIDELEKEAFEVVIFDEAQTIKNPKSRRSRAAQRLQRKFTLCLTGTPMENHIGEYHTILNLALPGLLGNYDDFQKRIRQGRGDLLRRARPFLLRRTKDEILKELPTKQESDLYLDMTPEQKEIYTRTVGEVREEVLSAYQEKTRAQAGIVALAALMRLRQTCVSPELLGHTLKKPAPKIEYLVNKLTELIDEGHSVLVFSQFLGALSGIENALKHVGITPLRLDGSTPVRKRQTIVADFQNAQQPQVFLISLKAGGVGLNLTNASYVFHVDPWWNPAVENQASDRAHRIGQTRTVFIQRLLMRHSVEEKIMALKARKKALFESIVDSQSSGKQSGPLISKEDFQFLLS